MNERLRRNPSLHGGSINILDLLNNRGINPRRAAGTHGGEYPSACPACGGNDRFHVWPDGTATRLTAHGLPGRFGVQPYHGKLSDLEDIMPRYPRINWAITLA